MSRDARVDLFDRTLADFIFVRQRYNDHFMETECWAAADGKILAMSQTKTSGHDILITGGNDGSISFWDADGHSHTSIASSVRSNGE